MHVIVNITTKQSHCVHNNNIAVFVVQYNYVVGPMARPGPPGRAWIYFLRSGPGPGLIIKFAGRARARSAQLLRARTGPGPHIIFAGRAWA